jgi:hypothetical protein
VSAGAAAKVRSCHHHLGSVSRDHFVRRGYFLFDFVLATGSDSYSHVIHPDDLAWPPGAGFPQICSLAAAAKTATRANNCSPWKTFPEPGRVTVVASQLRSLPLAVNCVSCLFLLVDIIPAHNSYFRLFD